jgi:hypothetical protein
MEHVTDEQYLAGPEARSVNLFLAGARHAPIHA